MKTMDLVEETIISLQSNKVRSGLTILGIVIGISSVIAMISIGQGASTSIQNNIQSLGANLLIVSPGVQRGIGQQVGGGRGNAKSLTSADAEALRALDGVAGVSPEVSGRYQLVSGGKNTNTQVTGVSASYPAIRNIDTEIGSFFSDSDIRNRSKIVILGPNVRDDLFGAGTDPTGQSVKIKNLEFKIVGVTKAKGSSGFGSQDDAVYIPYTTAQHYFTGDEYLTNISIQASSSDGMAATAQSITDTLIARHKISNPTLADFNVLNQSDIVNSASSITQTLTILLACVAGISLVVGGIGIMNMMLTSVTERTREIGLRKAIGAKRKDINLQFLVEAMALTLIGGALGVTLGILLSWGLSYLGILQTTISTYSILLSFGVSAVIGVVFGYYPATKAAALNPIEALRYE